MEDENILELVVSYAKLNPDDVVLEVGAGYGNLTETIAKHGCHVYAIEKDTELFEKLGRRLEEENISTISGDALKLDWPLFNKMVSNLPYHISKKTMTKLMLCNFELAVLVVQKEFAEKISEKPGVKNYRMISALAQTACDIRLMDVIPKNAFKPQPKVDSQIIILEKKAECTQEYAQFLTKLFNHKNKLLKNTLKNPPLYADKKPLELKPEELQKLYQALQD